MDWKEITKKVFLVVYRVIIPGIFIFFTAWTWSKASDCMKKYNVCLCLLLLCGLERVLVFARFYMKSTSLEFEGTILMTVTFVLNALDKDEFCNSPGNNDFLKFSMFLFKAIYFCNIGAYATAFFVLVLFGLILLFLIIRGRPVDSLNINIQGLTTRELNQLRIHKYSELVDDEEPVEHNCSICLVEFTLEDFGIQLPECKHIFHEDCIKAWFEHNNNCPICRNDVRQAIINQLLVPA